MTHPFARIAGYRGVVGRVSLPLVPILLAASACYSYRPTTAPVPAREPVRIRLDSPRELEVAFPHRGPISVQSVTVVEGRVLPTSGDTLRLSPTRLYAGGGWIPLVPGERGTVALPSGAVSRVERRRFAPEKVVGLAALGFLAWGVGLIIAVGTGSS